MTIKPRKEDTIFITVIILVHIVFFLLAIHYTRIYMGDSYEYIYEALNIENDFFFYSGNPAMPVLPEYMTQRQPLYPLFLLTIYTICLNNWIVLVVQNIISVFNICYARSVAHKLGYNKKFDWLFLLLVVAYPSQFINANSIAPDILLQTCTLLYFGCYLRLWQTKQIKYALYSSVWLVAGLMVKPVLYPFIIIHFFALIYFSIKYKLLKPRIILIAVMPVIAVALYNFDNYTRTGKYHFSSNQSFNAIYYFSAYFSHTQSVAAGNEFLLAERAKTNSFLTYKERYDYANNRGLTLLKDNFVPYMAYHLKNSARILIEPGKAEIDLFTGKLTYGKLYSKKEEGFYAVIKQKGIKGVGGYICSNTSMPVVILVILVNCIKVIGFILFLLNRSVLPGIRFFTFILISYFAVAAGPIANTRYFLPVSLIVTACAAIAITGKLQKRSHY